MLFASTDAGFLDLALGMDILGEVEGLPLNEFKDPYVVVDAITPRIREANAICKMSAI
jgi:hypothetical protein